MNKQYSEILAKTMNETVIDVGASYGIDMSIKVKKHLSMKEFARFVGEMKEVMFSEGEYRPQFGAIIFDITLCEYYTDFELPDDIGEAYEIIHYFGIVDKILGVIGNTKQFNTLIACIDEAQDFVKAQKTGMSGLLNSIKNAVDNFNVNEVLENLKSFDLEKLEHLSELKELAALFTTPPKPDDNVLKLPPQK